MRAIIIVAVILLVMVALGWLSFRASQDRATMTIETQKIEQDTEQAVEKGREVWQDARKNLRDGRDQPATSDPPAPIYP
jgi:Flp pilus assembly protein TadB